jgi:hypothetical protein
MLSLPSEVAGFSEPEFRGSEEIEGTRPAAAAHYNYASGRQSRH